MSWVYLKFIKNRKRTYLKWMLSKLRTTGVTCVRLLSPSDVFVWRQFLLLSPWKNVQFGFDVDDFVPLYRIFLQIPGQNLWILDHSSLSHLILSMDVRILCMVVSQHFDISYLGKYVCMLGLNTGTPGKEDLIPLESEWMASGYMEISWEWDPILNSTWMWKNCKKL